MVSSVCDMLGGGDPEVVRSVLESVAWDQQQGVALLLDMMST